MSVADMSKPELLLFPPECAPPTVSTYQLVQTLSFQPLSSKTLESFSTLQSSTQCVHKFSWLTFRIDPEKSHFSPALLPGSSKPPTSLGLDYCQVFSTCMVNSFMTVRFCSNVAFSWKSTLTTLFTTTNCSSTSNPAKTLLFCFCRALNLF